MKKHLLFTVLVFVAVIAAAAPRLRGHAPRPARQTVNAANTAMSVAAPVITPQAIGETTADYESITDWKTIGQSRYTDIFVAVSDGDTYAYSTYAVETEESESHPGLFRFKNCNQNPDYYYGSPDTSQDYYLIVDATDPDAVFIPLQKFGYTAYGDVEVWVQSWSSGTFDQENLRITFPDWGLVWRNGESGGANSSNNPNETLFNIWLPGAKDYTMSLYSPYACSADNQAWYYLEAGADITTIKCAFIHTADMSVEDALEQARVSETTVTPADDYQSFSMDEEGRYILALVGYDAEGNEKHALSELYYRYDDHSDQWKSLGNTIMTEDFIHAYYYYNWGVDYGYGPNTYEVELQENINTPGFYRVVNPMTNNNNTGITDYQSHDTDHNHYIFIHAEDPSAVSVTEAPIGLNWYQSGDVVMGSVSAGSIENGAVSMPAGTIRYKMGSEYYYNVQPFVVVIPKEHTVTVKSADEKYGTVAITDPATVGDALTTTATSVTVEATPADGAAFMNWTDAKGNVLSTEATYTYIGSDDFELTANFGLTVDYTNPANGFISVYNGENTVVSGSIFTPGTVLSITVTPKDSDYELAALYINGIEVTPDSEGKYEFALTESSTISAEFKEITYTLNIVTGGNGEIQVWTSVDETEELPAGTRLYDGDTYTGELFVWFIPGEGETLDNAAVTVNGVSQTLDFENEIDGWLVTNGQWGQAGNVYFYPSPISKAPVVFSAEFTGEAQGIEEIGIDPANGPVEYYNLQGIRVAEENLLPGFYIVRQGAKAVKILIGK